MLYGNNRVYILLLSSADECPFCFGGQECELEVWRALVVVRILSLGDGVCRNLRVEATVPVVDYLVPNCTGTCLYFDILVSSKHK